MVTLKTQEIPSGYNSEDYNSERVWALSRDGSTKVPISIVYKKSLLKKDGSNPLYLYGYGSYGVSVAPNFSTSVISLLDRGFVFAVAHIRGGDDLGFEWYEEAKFLNKKKTFDDFVDVAKCLIEAKYTSNGNIVIVGRSAGGMLVGNVINTNPELFKAVIADVPFVDVLNTMLDDSLPLTPGEFKEWGNPKDKEYFEYIKSYSPYDNVKKQQYPHMYVQAGLNDPRVTYWEPAKWVAKLREMKTDNNNLLLETNMSVGHGGNSKRFARIREVAKEYAFILAVFEVRT
jgi:oligopeptidase B